MLKASAVGTRAAPLELLLPPLLLEPELLDPPLLEDELLELELELELPPPLLELPPELLLPQAASATSRMAMTPFCNVARRTSMASLPQSSKRIGRCVCAATGRKGC
jgi:hypothetical protein